MSKEINKEYVVLAVKPSGQDKNLSHVIECDYHSVLNFVRALSFDATVELYFFDIEELRKNYTLTVKSEGVTFLIMNNEKSLNGFAQEVIDLLDRLRVRKEDPKENED